MLIKAHLQGSTVPLLEYGCLLECGLQLLALGCHPLVPLLHLQGPEEKGGGGGGRACSLECGWFTP